MQKKRVRTSANIRAEKKYEEKRKSSLYTLSIRFTPDEVKKIEENRGDMSKTAYIRMKLGF